MEVPAFIRCTSATLALIFASPTLAAAPAPTVEELRPAAAQFVAARMAAPPPTPLIERSCAADFVSSLDNRRTKKFVYGPYMELVGSGYGAELGPCEEQVMDWAKALRDYERPAFDAFMVEVVIPAWRGTDAIAREKNARVALNAELLIRNERLLRSVAYGRE